MVLVEASKLNLPQSPSSPPQILSAEYEPNSCSLALTHPDSSLSLYTPISQQPQTLTLIPPPVSSSTFVVLKSNSTSNSTSLEEEDDTRVIFVVASPVKAGTSICLRFYGAVRKGMSQVFSRVKVICKHKDCVFDEKLGAVVIKVNHGVAVRLSGDVNVFAMYVASSSRIWVFAVKMVNGGDGEAVKSMKCAVIECNVPVWCVSVSDGYLMLGEDNGVRVFLLRSLVKGNGGSKSVMLMHDGKRKGRHVIGKHMENVVKKPNGVVRASNGGFFMEGGLIKLNNGQVVGAKIDGNGMTVERFYDYNSDPKCNTHHGSVKLKSVKVGHESGIFKSLNAVNPTLAKSTNSRITTAKAISIKAMSANKCLILDSLGNLHLLSMSKLGGLKLNIQMRQLDQFIKVKKFAVLRGTQTVWISDGSYTVRMMMLDDIDPAGDENGEPVNDGNPTVSGSLVIFTSEKIQDVVSLSASTILIFGQGTCRSGQFESWIGAFSIKWPVCKFLIFERRNALQLSVISSSHLFRSIGSEFCAENDACSEIQ